MDEKRLLMINPSPSWYIFALRYKSWQRYMITGLALLGCLGIWFWFFYRSLEKKRTLLDLKVKEIQEKIDTTSIKESSCELGNSCTMITQLLHAITINGINLNSLEQQEIREESDILCVNFDLTSSFENLLAFIHYLTDNSPSLNIESYELAPLAKDGSLLSCLLTVSFYGERCAKFT